MYSFTNQRIGIVTVLERRNARGLSIRVSEDGAVHVTTRQQVSRREVEEYVADNEEWIENARRKIAKRVHPMTIFTPEISFETSEHKLLMTPDSHDKKVHLYVGKGLIHVSYPPTINPIENEVVQELTRKGIAFAFKVEGQKVLPQRLAELATIYGFSFRNVELKNLKSRWGACSVRKDIQLNVQLMRLPQHLVDHVILHELCHTIEMNHGPRFHALLDKIENGKSEQYEKELNKWSTWRW